MGHRSVCRKRTGGGLARGLVLVSLAAAACLPRGEPPAGRQILADASAALLGLVKPNGDGVLRVLFFRPGTTADLVDLWVLAVDPNGGPSSEKLLSTGIDEGLELSYQPKIGSGGFESDARGRLYVGTERIDPVTGATTDIGAEFPSISESGLRVLAHLATGGDTVTGTSFGSATTYNTGSYVLYEEDDSTTAINSQLAYFVGDSVLYLTNAGDLMRIAPGGVPEKLATGAYGFQAINDQHLLVLRPRADPSTPGVPATPPEPGSFTTPQFVSATILDLTTLVETALPDGPAYQNSSSFSPDGRYIAVTTYGQDPQSGANTNSSLLIDTQTGTSEPLDGQASFGGWRPGHLEFWMNGYTSPDQSFSAASISIKKPGQPPVTAPGYLSGFDTTGTYWFSSMTDPYSTTPSSALVGFADDPSGTRVPVAPPLTWFNGAWTLDDGRLLILASPGGDDVFDDFFAQIVDPRTGAVELFGERGVLSAVGNTQAVGVFQISYERGDLTTHDFATGQSTVLASEFAMAAVAEAQGPDPYPHGGRVVYQYRSHFASPWDGLWLATAP